MSPCTLTLNLLMHTTFWTADYCIKLLGFVLVFYNEYQIAVQYVQFYLIFLEENSFKTEFSFPSLFFV